MGRKNENIMIKNKIKIGLVALGTIATMGLSASSAFAANITYSADTDVYLTSTGYTLTIKSGSVATSVVVNASTIDIVVPISSTFTLASRNNVDLTGAGGATSTTSTCSGTTNTRVFTTGAGSTGTYTITPNGGVCAASAGGGGSSSTTTTTTSATPATPATPAVPAVTPAVPATPATPASPAVLKALPYPAAKTTAEMQANLAVLLENLTALQAQQKASAASPVAGASVPSVGSYNANIAPNSKGNSVTALQNFLKSQGADIYPEGLVTGFYGGLTKAAVGRFQIKQGIVASANDAGYGMVGPKTRAKINSLLGL